MRSTALLLFVLPSVVCKGLREQARSRAWLRFQCHFESTLPIKHLSSQTRHLNSRANMLQKVAYGLSTLLRQTSLLWPSSQHQLQPLAAPIGAHIGTTSQDSQNGLLDALTDALWLAVPKKKVTRSKKRMKTTAQKRIPLKKNIITDPRTGELTLQHKLPFNWKDYLPKTD